MKPDRLNAFTDGVIAIIITIMVLELPVPKAAGIAALKPELFLFGVYALSFLKVGIYWSNHHHMLQAVRRVNGSVLLANLLLLFWLSLVPFVVRWVGEAGITRDTVVAFGFVMLMCSISYAILKRTLVAAEGEDSRVARATGRDMKGLLSLVAYIGAIGIAFVSPIAAVLIYMAIAAMWLIPDKRFEQLID
jgi:TMEM175 potassium channel family protein